MNKYLPVFLVFLSLTAPLTAQTSAVSPTAVKPGAPAPSNPATLTPEDWRQLSVARAAALQANPDLVASSQKLRERMQAFQEKLNAAMIQADPKVEPIIAKMAANRPHPMMTGATPPPPAQPTPAKPPGQ